MGLLLWAVAHRERQKVPKKYAYYNEHDKYAAAWLREIIKRGLIMDGEVDERSIEDVLPSDVSGFLRVGFFAGIGGWELALQRARWPVDREVWHGSCPCQSFSTAGKGGGKLDERHLWPALFHLIGECRPPVFFGENVESSIGHGLLDTIQSDLESQGYAVGSAVLPSAGVGAQDIRSRLWFVGKRGTDGVAHSGGGRTGNLDREVADGGRAGVHAGGAELRQTDGATGSDRINAGSTSDELGDPQHTRCEGDGLQPIPDGRAECEQNARATGSGTTIIMGISDSARPFEGRQGSEAAGYGRTVEPTGGTGDSPGDRCTGHGQTGQVEEGLQPRPEFTGELSDGLERYGYIELLADTEHQGRDNRIGVEPRRADNSDGRITPAGSKGGIRRIFRESGAHEPASRFWDDADWLYCRDGKWRAVESGTYPLVGATQRGPLEMADGLYEGMVRGGDNGVPIDADRTAEARVMRLKGYGNAINPEVAKIFIESYLESEWTVE